VDYPHLRVSDRRHDRLGLLRTDEEWLARAWAEESARVLVVAGTRVRPVAGALEWLPTSAAPDGVRLLLGERDGRTWWAVLVDAEVARDDSAGPWLPLRGLLPAFAAGDAEHVAPLAFHALGLAEWLWATRHCPRCGGRLEVRSAGHELRCLDCGRPQFPRTDPAVIMLITDGEPGSPEEQCLLGRAPQWPEGRFSTLAGFCEPGESLEDAVRREVAEETGVVVGEVSYFGNQPWPLPSSLMLGFHGLATSSHIEIDHKEIADARWFTRGELLEEATAGGIQLPHGVSISRSLIEHWYGGSLPGHWR